MIILHFRNDVEVGNDVSYYRWHMIGFYYLRSVHCFSLSLRLVRFNRAFMRRLYNKTLFLVYKQKYFKYDASDDDLTYVTMWRGVTYPEKLSIQRTNSFWWIQLTWRVWRDLTWRTSHKSYLNSIKDRNM